MNVSVYLILGESVCEGEDKQYTFEPLIAGDPYTAKKTVEDTAAQILSKNCTASKSIKETDDYVCIVSCEDIKYEWRIKKVETEISMPRFSEAEVAQATMNAVNCFGFRNREYAREIANSHRTLQQSWMRMAIETIRELAKTNSDERNKSTVALAKEIIKVADDYSLPLV